MPERPVLALHLHQVDEDILKADANCFVKAMGDGAVEGFLLLQGAALVPGDLDADEVIGARNAQVAGVVDEAIRFVLLDDLEAIILGAPRC